MLPPQFPNRRPLNSGTARNVVHLIEVYNHMAGAFPHKNLAHTLHEQAVDTVWESHDTPHGLAFAQEWDHQEDLGGVSPCSWPNQDLLQTLTAPFLSCSQKNTMAPLSGSRVSREVEL